MPCRVDVCPQCGEYECPGFGSYGGMDTDIANCKYYNEKPKKENFMTAKKNTLLK